MTVTFDPAKLTSSASNSLSGGNLILTADADGSFSKFTAVSSAQQATSKGMFEVTLTSIPSGTGATTEFYVGLLDDTIYGGYPPAGNRPGLATPSVGIGSGKALGNISASGHEIVASGTQSYSDTTAPVNGDVITVAFDKTNGLAYFAKNGTWLNGANPSAGTGGVAITFSANVLAAVGVYVANTGEGPITVTANFGASAFTASLPTGYSAWDGSGGSTPDQPAQPDNYDETAYARLALAQFAGLDCLVAQANPNITAGVEDQFGGLLDDGTFESQAFAAWLNYFLAADMFGDGDFAVNNGGPINTPIAITATSSSSLVLVKAEGKAITLSSASVASLARMAAYARAITIAEGSAPAVIRSIGKPLTISEGSAASLLAGRSYARALSAAEASALMITRGVGKPISATAGSSPTIGQGKAFARSISAAGSSVASLARAIAQTFAFAAPNSASLTMLKSRGVALATSAPSSASVGRGVGKPIAASAGSAPSIARVQAILRTLSASAASIATLGRVTARNVFVTATAGSTANLTTLKAKGVAITASGSSSALLTRTAAFQRAIPIAEPSTLTFTRSLSKFVTISAPSAASVSRTTSKAISAAVSSIMAISRAVGKMLSLSGSSAPSVARTASYLRTISLAETSAPTLVRPVSRPRTLTFTSTSTASLTAGKVYLRSITTTEGATASLSRVLARGILINPAAPSSLTIARGIGKGLTVSAASVATLARPATFNRSMSLSASSIGLLTSQRVYSRLITTIAPSSAMVAKQRSAQRAITAASSPAVAVGRGISLGLQLAVGTLAGVLHRYIAVVGAKKLLPAARQRTLTAPTRKRTMAVPARQRTFLVPRKLTPMKMPNKVVNEDLKYTIDFSNWEWFKSGDTITGCTPSVRSGSVTATYVDKTASAVRIEFAGGQAGEQCEIWITVTTQSGDTLTEPCFMQVVG